MRTHTSRPHSPGSNDPRSGGPLPGQHLPGTKQPEFADPGRIRAEIDALLAELAVKGRDSGNDAEGAGVEITRRARILEQAHDLLVRALATVDTI